MLSMLSNKRVRRSTANQAPSAPVKGCLQGAASLPAPWCCAGRSVALSTSATMVEHVTGDKIAYLPVVVSLVGLTTREGFPCAQFFETTVELSRRPVESGPE